MLHAGSALKPWFCDFLTSCLRQDLEKSANSCYPKAGKATGEPKELSAYISAVCALQDP